MSDFFDSVDMDQLMAELGQDYAFATTPTFHEPVYRDPACHDPFNVDSVESELIYHEPVSHGGEAIPLDPQTAFIDMPGWPNFPGFDMPLVDQYDGLGAFTNNQGNDPSTDFLANLDNPQNATDTSFMDLLPAIGYEDGHVSMPELGSAASLDQ
ncbi:hypothetical protein CTRI78_v010316 [Colletotrichum trifolii]|uniref:Uncharacterized protein n=1 Tax=Colletotrichum trifolii TaxID=5466 RepID=A0A4R8QPS7_COLTR|nr:hypothetical protein CTRI78_v010316 [Colletotrichum trifolii]